MVRRTAAERLASLHQEAVKIGDRVACEDVCWAAKTQSGLARKLREHCVSIGIDFSKRPKQGRKPKDEVDADSSPGLNEDDVPVDEADRIPHSENHLALLQIGKLKRICNELDPKFFNECTFRALTPKRRRSVPKSLLIEVITFMTNWPSDRPFGGMRSVHYLVQVLLTEHALCNHRGVGAFRLPINWSDIGIYQHAPGKTAGGAAQEPVHQQNRSVRAHRRCGTELVADQGQSL